MESIGKIKEFLRIRDWEWARKEEQDLFMEVTDSWCSLLGFFEDKEGRKGYIEKNPLSSDWGSDYIRVHYVDEPKNPQNWTHIGPSLTNLGLTLKNPFWELTINSLREEGLNSLIEELEEDYDQDDSTILAFLYGRQDYYIYDEPDPQMEQKLGNVINKLRNTTPMSKEADMVRAWWNDRPTE